MLPQPRDTLADWYNQHVPTDTVPSKVEYGDGTLSFRIPSGWVAERENDDSTVFFQEAAAPGMLRVKVMTFTSKEVLAADVARGELEAMAPEPGQSLEVLPNGNVLRAHREQAVVDGTDTAFQVWLLASVDPPHRMRLAVFSFAVAGRRTGDLETRRTLATLNREIRQALFAHQVS